MKSSHVALHRHLDLEFHAVVPTGFARATAPMYIGLLCFHAFHPALDKQIIARAHLYIYIYIYR